MGDNYSSSEQEFETNPYKKEDKKTLAEVIIAQIDFCRQEFSKEMKKGFEQKVFLGGEWGTITIPDQRKSSIQATKTLKGLLLFYFDKDITGNLKSIQEKIDGAEDKYKKKFEEVKNIERPKQSLSNIGYAVKHQVRQKNMSDSVLWERMEQYKLNYLAECYREVFEELVLLFKRRNELSGKRALGYK